MRRPLEAIRRPLRLPTVIVPAVREGLWLRDDFVTTTFSTQTLGGTGFATHTGGDAGRPGWLEIGAVAATGVDAASVGGGTSLNTILLGGGELAIEWAINLTEQSDGVDNLSLRVGLGDDAAAADFTDGVYFEYDLGAHASLDWRLCTADGGSRTKTTAGAGVRPAGGVWTRLTAVVAHDASAVAFSIDGILRGTLTTDIPVAGFLAPVCQFIKTLGGSSRSVVCDYWDLTQRFTVRR